MNAQNSVSPTSPQPGFIRRALRRIFSRQGFFALVVLITLTALFYAEENWRGKRAWERTKRELEAKGEKLDWLAVIPQPVPDDQNVMEHPFMRAHFVKGTENLAFPIPELFRWPRFKSQLLGGYLADMKELPRQKLALPELASLCPELAAANVVERIEFKSTALGDAVRSLAKQAGIEVVFDNRTYPFGYEAFTKGVSRGWRSNEVSLSFTNVSAAKALDELLRQQHLTVERDAANALRLRPIEISLPEVADWLNGYEPQIRQLEDALRRPYSRLKGDYSRPYAFPLPNFVSFRSIGQVLDARCKVNLLLGNPDAAFRDFVLLRRLADCVAANEPPILIEVMIRAHILSLCAANLQETLQAGLWPERHLAALQEQMHGLNLLAGYADSLRYGERAAGLHFLQGLTEGGAAEKVKSIFPFNAGHIDPMTLALVYGPRGWIYQNMASYGRLMQSPSEGVDPAGRRIDVGGVDRGVHQVEDYFNKLTPGPWNIFSTIAIPSFVTALQAVTRIQTKADEAYLALGLERYRLAEGKYPDSLAALVPKYAAEIPRDLFDGQPLRYRKTKDGKFILYSIGWNSKDDGGPANRYDKVPDWSTKGGDWPWQLTPIAASTTSFE